MTPELKAKIEKTAFEYFPTIPTARAAYAIGAKEWASKLESIREEVEKRKKEKFSRSFKTEELALEANGAFNEASEILSIIDKHLKE